MYERFRIHHGVGSRVLFDSDKDTCSFSMHQNPDGFLFLVNTERTPSVEEVLRLRGEVNVFIFKEEDGVAVEKIWYYTGTGEVAYDDGAKCLRIHATHHIAYKPSDFELA